MIISQTLQLMTNTSGCGQHKIVSNLNLICQTAKLNDLPILPIVQ